MYGGKIVEEGPAAEVFKRPAHPYTGDLLRSTPRIDQRLDRLISIEGAPPDLLDPPPGCPYEPRCALAVDACLEPPALARFGPNRTVACWRAGEAEESMHDAGERRERYAAR
jgi:oligopeptide/dipeptide ABC transporter ATP-binding protein